MLIAAKVDPAIARKSARPTGMQGAGRRARNLVGMRAHVGFVGALGWCSWIDVSWRIVPGVVIDGDNGRMARP